MSDRFITSVRVERLGNHDHVTVFVRGAMSGTLVIDAGLGQILARLLEGAEEAGELRVGMSVAWPLVKDFSILYRAAVGAVESETIADARTAREYLRLQLERLKPAYETTEFIREAARAGATRPATDVDWSRWAADDDEGEDEETPAEGESR